MRKNIFFALLLALAASLSMGCSGGNGALQDGAVKYNGLPQDYPSGHNAMNSLDYQGVYLASTGQPGGILIVELGADKAKIVHTEGVSDSGPYRWDVTGSVITVRPRAGDALRFFVGENFLRLLDGPQEGLILKKRQ